MELDNNKRECIAYLNVMKEMITNSIFNEKMLLQFRKCYSLILKEQQVEMNKLNRKKKAKNSNSKNNKKVKDIPIKSSTLDIKKLDSIKVPTSGFVKTHDGIIFGDKSFSFVSKIPKKQKIPEIKISEICDFDSVDLVDTYIEKREQEHFEYMINRNCFLDNDNIVEQTTCANPIKLEDKKEIDTKEKRYEIDKNVLNVLYENTHTKYDQIKVKLQLEIFASIYNQKQMDLLEILQTELFDNKKYGLLFVHKKKIGKEKEILTINTKTKKINKMINDLEINKWIEKADAFFIHSLGITYKN